MKEPTEMASLIHDLIKSLKSESDSESMKTLDQIEANLDYPVKRSFKQSDTYENIKSENRELVELWVILEDKHSGYCVVYDEEADEFGLSLKGSDGVDRFIGARGSLLYAYDAM